MKRDTEKETEMIEIELGEVENVVLRERETEIDAEKGRKCEI